MEMFILDQILCLFFSNLCQNGHYLFSLSQMKACTIRKTNISSEFCALVIQKKNYCLLAADLDHNLLWLSLDCLA